MKKRILFVGSFKDSAKDGSVGGQMFACNTIMKSELSNHFQWILLDTTALSNNSTWFIIRLLMAIKRLILFTFYTLFYKIDKYLIFVGDGWSFWEKGLMILIAKAFSKAETILAPRSGFIENDIEFNKKLRTFIIYVLKKTNKVICQSEKWQKLFINLTNSKEKKFIIIENGINPHPYIDFPIDKTNIPNKKITVLYLSWVDKNKGIFDLLDAVLLLKQKDFDFKLIIAGKGSAYDDALKFVLTHNLINNVNFVGWVYGEEKFKLLNSADIFILPTHFEGYPNSLLEAMISGKACISTNVGSIPDMISNNKTGLLINKNNSAEIYNALKFLITEDKIRLSISEEARNIASKRNSIETFVSKFNELLIS